jgi:hypothetical protein
MGGNDFDHALLKDQQTAGARSGGEHQLARLVGCKRKAGELPLKECDVGNKGCEHVSCHREGGLYASCRCEIGESIIPKSSVTKTEPLAHDWNNNVPRAFRPEPRR